MRRNSDSGDSGGGVAINWIDRIQHEWEMMRLLRFFSFFFFFFFSFTAVSFRNERKEMEKE